MSDDHNGHHYHGDTLNIDMHGHPILMSNKTADVCIIGGGAIKSSAPLQTAQNAHCNLLLKALDLQKDHANSLNLTGESLLFRQTLRKSALRHDMSATFIAKSMSRPDPSAGHIHLRIKSLEKNKAIFASEKRVSTERLLNLVNEFGFFLAAILLFAPNTNSCFRPTISTIFIKRGHIHAEPDKKNLFWCLGYIGLFPEHHCDCRDDTKSTNLVCIQLPGIHGS